MTSKERMIENFIHDKGMTAEQAIEAYLEHMRSIAKKAKTTTHGFQNPDVQQKAYEARWGKGRTPKKRR